MRERSTWNLQEIAKKAAKKQAAEVAGDIYSMNQDHPQPAADEYVIGDPSDFAEDVHEPNTWESEYSDGQTARDEIGMPELRKDTFNHPEKTASDKVRLKKAELCVAVAKMMLKGKKVAGVDAIEDQAYGLMYMPDQELINTHKRLAAEQEQGDFEEDADSDLDDDTDDESDEGQGKQAGEVPPQFKENIEKMKAKSKGDDDDDDDDGGGQQKQADEMPDFIKDKIEDKEDDEDQGEKKQASQVGQMQQMMSQLQRMMRQAQGQQSDGDDDADDEEPAQQKQAKSKSKTSQGLKEPKNEGGDQNAKANDNWPTKAATEQVAQMQQMLAQLQQMIQQAQGQGQQQMLGDGQQLPGQQAPVMAQGDELDQLLAQQDCGPMAEGDIEMEPAPMDVDNVVLAGEDEILRTLFAQDEQDQGEEEQVQQSQAKQAAVRTASTRTVGTRPTSGVAKLGGSVSKTAASIETDRLSSLWQTAPDVRESFGLK